MGLGKALEDETTVFSGQVGLTKSRRKPKPAQNEIPSLPSDPITSVTPLPPSLSLPHTYPETEQKHRAIRFLSPKKLPSFSPRTSSSFVFASKWSSSASSSLMAEKEGFEVDQLGVVEGTSFSQLLFEVEHDVVGLCVDDHQNQIFNYYNNNSTCSSLYSAADLKSPKMLCFGDFQNNNSGEIGFPEISKPPPKSGVTCSDSSSVSSTSKSTSTKALSSSKPSNKKRNGLGQELVQCASTTTVAGQRSSKKSKTDKPAPAGNGKRREKLGERISTLQQLVSPFGKTDTASVLHEAMGYIRFLHDQVQVLCSPYLQRLPSLPDGEEEKKEEATSNDLRSRGLCLVPMDCTAHVANNNGADFWSPVTMAHRRPDTN